MNRTNLKCPKCGSSDVDVVKTWQLASPLPDKYGRITVTVMGSIVCKKCGYSWRGVVSKIKVGEKSVSIGDRELGGEEEERRVKEIVLDLEDILREGGEE